MDNHSLWDQFAPTVTFYDASTTILMTFISVCFVDLIIARQTKCRWFLLHAVYNFIACYFALEDVIYAFLNPVDSLCSPGYSKMPLYCVVSIHVYHMVAFKLNGADWFHHLTFVGIIGGIGFVGDWGHVENCYVFFMSGLPGGLDYILLCLVKHGYMEPLTEKGWNARINVWLRGPGCLISGFILYVGYNNCPTTLWHWTLVVVMMFLCMFNGQYYMQMVVGNTFRKDELYVS